MTLLIRNVKILGGEGKFSELADVLVNDDRISAIGSFPNKGADEIIDGQGAYLSPGFIDVNTDSDHFLSLFDFPEQTDFLRQGVTTIVGGMCGSSLAPLLYGSLESVQKWGDISKVNVNWHSVKEFFATFEKKPLGVNFATLVGHSTIRRALVGPELRELTKNELEVFGGTLTRALDEGGAGLSTGLSYVHSQRTPYSEIKFLTKIVEGRSGVYATHLRKGGAELGESIDETIKVAKETGVKTAISHFMPILGAEKEYEAALGKIESLPAELDFGFDVYPYDVSVLAIYTFLPSWVQSGGREVMLANLRDPWFQARIEKDLAQFDPKDFVIAQAPGNDVLVGKSLEEVCSIYDAPNYRAALIKLMATTELKGIIFCRNISKRLIALALKSPRSFIASNAASFGEDGKTRALKPERATSTFTKFLSMVQADNLMPLEEAIKKITILPAKKFNLKNRGVIKEGNFADLALFSLAENSAEVKYTIVNGAVAFRRGEFTGKSAGKTLKHSQ